jgi:hypothetical protein
MNTVYDVPENFSKKVVVSSVSLFDIFTRTRDSATRTLEDRTISIGIRMTNHLKATNASRWTRLSNNQPLINSLNDRWNGHGQRLSLVMNRISLCYRCLYDQI